MLALGYVVVPPSRHESQHTYDWIKKLGEVPLPDAPEWAVQMLRESRSCKVFLEELPEDLLRIDVEDLPIPSDKTALIREGKPRGERSEALSSVICSMLFHGCPLKVVASAVLDPGNGISEKPREKGRKWVKNEMARAIA